jgi:hypothetical protein
MHVLIIAEKGFIEHAPRFKILECSERCFLYQSEFNEASNRFSLIIKIWKKL